MARRWIHLEQLVGRKVRDSQGAAAGRIQEVHAKTENGQTLVTEYVLGKQGLMERLSISGVSMSILRNLRALQSPAESSHHVPWKMMDLSDPRRPRLRCTNGQLRSTPPNQ